MTEQHSVKADTEYAVLRFDDEDFDNETSVMAQRWVFVDSVVARSAEAAVKQLVGKAAGPDGVYVAVPSRSWKPLQVTTKTETTLIVEDAPAEEAS